MTEQDIRNRMHGGWAGQFYIGPGWIHIVVELDKKIASKFPNYEVYQVKEKFGGLRYYTSVDRDEDVRDWINFAEGKASVTCEECGEPGKMTQISYLMVTLCPTHEAEKRKVRGL